MNDRVMRETLLGFLNDRGKRARQAIFEQIVAERDFDGRIRLLAALDALPFVETALRIAIEEAEHF
jgi:hypothetical protein